MSALLWYGTGEDDALDLGNPLTMWQAFKAIGLLCGDDRRFDELQSVPGFAEQEVTPWWLGEVGKQAGLFLDEYGDRIDESTRELLETLQGGAQQEGEAPSDKPPDKGDKTMPDTAITRKSEDVHPDTPETEEHEHAKKPGLLALEDIHDGLHNTMKAIIDHHRNLVEHPDDVAHLDAMEGMVKDMCSQNADHHAERYPEEEPLEKMDDDEDKAGTGGDQEPGGQTTEIQAKADTTAAAQAAPVATTTARAPARDDRTRRQGGTRKSLSPAERTLQRLRQENERLMEELASAD